MSLQRRQVLGASAVAALSGLAGCTVGFGGSPATVDLYVTNDHDTAHEVDVRVEFEGETLFDNRFSVGPGEEKATAFKNPDTSGDATLVAELRSGASAERDVRAGKGSGLSSLTVEIGEDGDLSAFAAVR